MKTRMKHIEDEQGFVLVAALLIMLMLTLLGIATTTNTSIELQIAGNDKVHKKSFYEAEAGAMLGSELLEQNFNCATGFSAVGGIIKRNGINADPPSIYAIHARDLQITNNLTMSSETINDKLADPINQYDAAYPLPTGALPLPAQEVGYLYFGGATNVAPGGALEMAAGYEGKGKSSAQGGVSMVFDIYSQFKGLTNSESIVMLGWRHVVGTESTCDY